jgi:hypothetical protein
MNGIENHHLSPEVIEDAVLGRLSAEQRAEADAHLAVCPVCREAIEQERLLAAGTRAWARAAMRQRLTERIAGSRQRSIPWPHVLGAAALFVVIVGVGALFHWREPAPEQNLVLSDSVITPLETSQLPHASAPGSGTNAIKAEPSDKVLRFEAPKPADIRKKDAAEADALMSAAPSQQSEEKVIAERSRQQPSIAEAQAEAPPTPASGKLDNRGVVVSGTQVRDATMGYAQKQPAGASQQGVSLQRLEARKGKETTGGGQRLTFVIRQRLVGEFTNDQNTDGAAFPAEIVRSGDTLNVTLLVNSLLPPAELLSAYGRQVSPDSLQVIFPDRILGYRLPGALAR